MKEIRLPHLHESAVTSSDFPALGEAGIVLIGFTRVTRPCRRKPQVGDSGHAHLHITLRGRASATLDGGMTAFPARHAFIVPPGAPPWAWHADAGAEDPWEVVFVRLSGRFRAPGFRFGSRACIRSGCDPLDLLWSYQRLHREALQPSRPVIVASLVAMIAHHVGEVLSPEHKPPLLTDLWSRVAAHPENPWRLEYLARLAGMSRESLRQVCLRETGLNPVQQVTRLRMRHAATLLRSGLHRVGDVARLVGYENPYNFSTAFKRARGISPKQFQLHPPAGSADRARRG